MRGPIRSTTGADLSAGHSLVGRLAIARNVLTVLLHHFGISEPRRLEPDGAIVSWAWGRTNERGVGNGPRPRRANRESEPFVLALTGRIGRPQRALRKHRGPLGAASHDRGESCIPRRRRREPTSVSPPAAERPHASSMTVPSARTHQTSPLEMRGNSRERVACRHHRPGVSRRGHEPSRTGALHDSDGAREGLLRELEPLDSASWIALVVAAQHISADCSLPDARRGNRAPIYVNYAKSLSLEPELLARSLRTRIFSSVGVGTRVKGLEESRESLSTTATPEQEERLRLATQVAQAVERRRADQAPK